MHNESDNEFVCVYMSKNEWVQKLACKCEVAIAGLINSFGLASNMFQSLIIDLMSDEGSNVTHLKLFTEWISLCRHVPFSWLLFMKQRKSLTVRMRNNGCFSH